MDGDLKLNSTFAFMFGPFLASSDAYTPSTGLTISSVAVMLSKNGAAFAAKDDPNALTATEDTGGFYLCRLNSTDINTVGQLKVYNRTATALPVWASFRVLSSEAYNALYTAGGVPAGSFSDALWKRMGVSAYGTATDSTTASLTLASTESVLSDQIIGQTLFLTGGATGSRQSRAILDYDSTSKIATVDAWVTVPSTDVPYVIIGSPPASAAAPAPANVTEWNGAAVAAPTQAGVPEVDVTYIAGAAVNTASAQLGVNVVTFTAASLDTSALSAGVITAVQAGLATSTEVSSGFAAQTARLSTMAATLANVSTQVAAVSSAVSSNATAMAALSTSVPADVLNSTIDGAYTLRQVHRGYAAVLLGKVSGSSGAITVFRDINDVTDRVTAGVDTSGNRSTIVLVLT